MPTGQGNISVNQKSSSGGSVPPFPLTSAENGVSVDPASLRIVLGQTFGAAGNPAQLLHNTEIPLNGKLLLLGAATEANRILINPLANQINLQTSDLRAGSGSNLYLDLNFASKVYQMGDITGAGNNDAISIDDTNRIFKFSDRTKDYLSIDNSTRNYKFGDINNALNGKKLTIDDTNKDLYFGDPTFTDPVIEIFGFSGSSIIDMWVPDNSGNYVDWFLSNNGVAHFAALTTKGTNSYEMVMRIDDAVLGDFFSIDKFNAPPPTRKKFFIDFINELFQFGDINAENNGTFLSIDDTNNEFAFKNTANTSAIRINGTLGFTGTVAPVNTITVVGGIVTNVA